MINGNSVILAFGKETTYGTAAAPTQKIQFSSADFKSTPNKVEAGLLTGGKAGSAVETMSINTEGSLSTLAKPETIGHFLKGALGVEGTVATSGDKKKHTFTAIGNGENDYLPSYTFVLDRKVKCTGYNGMVMNTLALSAEAEGYLSVDVGFIGRGYASGTIGSSVKAAETNKAFKFNQGSVKVGSTSYDVTSINFNLNNNCDGLFTTGTGLYKTRPQQGMREITADVELIYSTQSEAVRDDYWLTDVSVALELSFVDDDDNKLTITLPACQVTACDEPAISGAETLKQSVSFKAIDSASELISVELVNDLATAY